MISAIKARRVSIRPMPATPEITCTGRPMPFSALRRVVMVALSKHRICSAQGCGVCRPASNSFEFLDDGAVVFGYGIRGAIHQMQQHLAALDMGENWIPRPRPSDAPSIRPGMSAITNSAPSMPTTPRFGTNVVKGNRRSLAARSRRQQGRWISRHWQASSPASAISFRRSRSCARCLPRIGAGGRAVGRGFECEVTPAAVPPLRQNLLAHRHEIGDTVSSSSSQDLGTDRNLQDDIVAGCRCVSTPCRPAPIWREKCCW